MDTDFTSHCDRYRAIANELRHLAPKMKLAEAAHELHLLAASYETLAEHLEAAPILPAGTLTEPAPQ